MRELFARLNVFATLARIERKLNDMAITQEQFDADLKPLTDAIPTVIAALEGKVSAQAATIASLTAQLNAAGTAPPAPDFSAEDAAVVAAKAELDAALATVTPAPAPAAEAPAAAPEAPAAPAP
jgi:pyruvate dehydrogenase E2 component (dihydrolipoyllysine-residue acetyltransferase)